MHLIGITGSRGVLGRLLVEQFTLAGTKFSEFSGDIRDGASVATWLREHQPTAILHLAARVPVQAVEKDPIGAYDVNVGGTENLMKAIQSLDDVPWLFLASSSHVYRSSCEPISENGVLGPQTVYGRTKLLAEEVARYLGEHLGVETCIGRIFSFYHRSQAPSFLYPSILERLRQHDFAQEFVVEGGNDVRDLSKAEDIVESIVRLMERRSTGTINIGSGEGTGIADFIRWCGGPELKIKVVDKRTPTALVADVSRLRAELNAQ